MDKFLGELFNELILSEFLEVLEPTKDKVFIGYMSASDPNGETGVIELCDVDPDLDLLVEHKEGELPLKCFFVPYSLIIVPSRIEATMSVICSSKYGNSCKRMSAIMENKVLKNLEIFIAIDLRNSLLLGISKNILNPSV